MMKKLSVQVGKHRFDLESSGAEMDALVARTAAELNARIEKLRRAHGFPDSARAAALAALFIAIESKKDGKDSLNARQSDTIMKIGQQIDLTLDRTSTVSPAEAKQQ